MFQKLSKTFSKNAITFISIFMGVQLLLGIGFILGWKSGSFAFLLSTEKISEIGAEHGATGAALHNHLRFEEVIQTDAFLFILLIGTILTILLCWTFLLLVKSIRDKNIVSKTNTALQKEIEKRENATNELQLTHQQLSTTTGQLDGIIDGTTDLIAAIDQNYKFISFNDSFKRNIKQIFDSEIEIGMTLDSALEKYPEKLKRSRELWSRALKGEKFTANQVFSISLDKPLYFEISYTPIKNSEGIVIGASQINRDVTQRQLTAENLKQEKDFISAIFDVNSSLIIVLDREGRILRFNNACENTSGYTEEEVKGRVFWNILIPTEEITEVKNSYQKLDSSQFQKEWINHWITKDEKIRLLSWQMSSIEDENGSSEFIVATGIDITEKREFETSQKRMLELLENSTDFIRISDLQGQVTYLNPAGKKMLGLDVESDITHLRSVSCHPNWANELMQEVGYPTAVKNGTWLGESAIKTLDNKEFPASQLILSHRNENNKLNYFSTVIRDISEQKSLENDLEKARDTALETTRVKSEFLANMSHEIRTPMNGVIGIAELLLGTKLDEEQKDFAVTIQSSGETLLTIINDILDFSKLEAGKLKFEHVEFDLHKTVEATLEIFTKTIEQKGLDLYVLIHKDVPSALLGDPGRLRQILINLISNAIKFTEKGEVIIKLKLEKDGKTPKIHFSVKDTGIGISEEVQTSLFKAFTQADVSIANRFGGTGLGLAISKQLVGYMNGEIGVSSELGKGSTFWFTATFETQNNKLQTNVTNDKIKNKQILIVSKNQTQNGILLYQTKSWGMLADKTESFHKAFELLIVASQQNDPFELVILELDKSTNKGLEFISKIKADPNLRKTKILTLISNKKRSITENENRLGIDNHLNKPIRQTHLFQTVVNMFSNQNELESSQEALFNNDEHLKSGKIRDKDGASTMHNEIINNSRILIAEDNLVNQKVILNQVSRLGYEVDLVENGQEAMDALQLKEYSLILMDCQMPVIDGFEATKLIRKKESGTHEHIPIIAVTAHAIEGDREKCLEIGMDDYISKPTKQQILADAISFWLNQTIQIVDNEEIATNVSVMFEAGNALSEQDNIDQRLSELEENCGCETVLECVKLFLEDTTNVLQDLANDMERLDFHTLAIDAHKLKGSAANMGASRLPKLCQKLIEFSRNEKDVSTNIILKQIIDEYEFLKTIYEKKRDEYEELLSKLLTV